MFITVEVFGGIDEELDDFLGSFSGNEVILGFENFKRAFFSGETEHVL